MLFRSFLENHSCDIVISEVRVAGFDAIDSLEDLRKCNEGMKLVLFSYDENPTHIARATIADVWDFLLKKESVQRLIRSCELTQSSVRPEDSLVQRVKQFLARPPKPVDSLAIPFTKREYQILSHLSLGLSNRDISRSLNISKIGRAHV